jgi:hypothetical protein
MLMLPICTGTLLRSDSLGCVADVELDNGTSITFGISETDFNALGGI